MIPNICICQEMISSRDIRSFRGQGFQQMQKSSARILLLTSDTLPEHMQGLMICIIARLVMDRYARIWPIQKLPIQRKSTWSPKDSSRHMISNNNNRILDLDPVLIFFKMTKIAKCRSYRRGIMKSLESKLWRHLINL